MARKIGELVHKGVNRASAESRPVNLTKASGGNWRTTTLIGVRSTGITRIVIAVIVDPPRETKAKGPASRRGPLFGRGAYVRPSTRNVDYLLPLFLAALSSLPVPALPWPAGLRASPFLEPVLIPVVVPDFILLDFIL